MSQPIQWKAQIQNDYIFQPTFEDLYQAFKKRYDREQQERKSKPCNSFPESWVCKSEKQIQLERQGCRFNGQELLDNHELDPEKPCQCGRPGR